MPVIQTQFSKREANLDDKSLKWYLGQRLDHWIYLIFLINSRGFVFLLFLAFIISSQKLTLSCDAHQHRKVAPDTMAPQASLARQMGSRTPQDRGESCPPASTTKDLLNDLPTEILIHIAGYLVQYHADYVLADDFLDYTTSQGQLGRFRVCPDVGQYDITTTRLISRCLPYMCKKEDVLNLACSNKRMREVCEPVLYNHLVLHANNPTRLASLKQALGETKPYLRKYVSHMTIEDYSAYHPRYQNSPEIRIEALLGSVFRGFKALTNLEIRMSPVTIVEDYWNISKKRNSEWCRILPELTSLRRLSMTGVDGFYEFPLLPQVQEACFDNCGQFENRREPKRRSLSWGAILKNLPALHTLVSTDSFKQVEAEDFIAVRDTLETLYWDHFFSSRLHGGIESALRELRCLKHLKIGSFALMLARDNYRIQRLQDLQNLAQTVETLDFQVGDYRLFSPLQQDGLQGGKVKCYCDKCPRARGFWKIVEDMCRTNWRNVRMIRVTEDLRCLQEDYYCLAFCEKAEVIERFRSDLGIKVLYAYRSWT